MRKTIPRMLLSAAGQFSPTHISRSTHDPRQALPESRCFGKLVFDVPKAKVLGCEAEDFGDLTVVFARTFGITV